MNLIFLSPPIYSNVKLLSAWSIKDRHSSAKIGTCFALDKGMVNIIVITFVSLLFACGPLSGSQQNNITNEAQAIECESFLQAEYSREVAGAHRSCEVDSDCVSVKLDCSNTECTAVHLDYSEDYDQPIDCNGYTGPVADYECLPPGNEIPTCNNGCCTNTVLELP